MSRRSFLFWMTFVVVETTAASLWIIFWGES